MEENNSVQKKKLNTEEVYHLFFPVKKKSPNLLLLEVETHIENDNVDFSKLDFSNYPVHPFAQACSFGWTHIVKYIFRESSKEQKTKLLNDSQNLYFSIAGQHQPIVNFLLDQGANLYKQDFKTEMTALDLAIFTKQYDVAENILMYGYDLKFSNHRALACCLQTQNTHGVKFILNHYPEEEYQQLKNIFPEIKLYPRKGKMLSLLGENLSVTPEKEFEQLDARPRKFKLH